jgi:hypothetical protein
MLKANPTRAKRVRRRATMSGIMATTAKGASSVLKGCL